MNRSLHALLLAFIIAAGCAASDSRAASDAPPLDAGAERGASDDDELPNSAETVPAAPSSDAGLSDEAPESVDEADLPPSGGDCTIRTIDVYGAAPDMLIVLDRSLSMSLNRRWEPSKLAVKAITRDFGALLRFGMSVFPGSGGDCAQGQLDVPLTISNGPAIAQLVDHTQTSGLTPTGPALSEALRILGDRRPILDLSTRPGYVLLVTDGEPNCQALPLFPDTAQQDAARDAVRALRASNIPTYVIGYQIDSTSQGMMNELAQLGGTSRYRPVENGEQIVSTFREITKDVVKCSFDLSELIDPRFVRVQIDQESIALDASDGFRMQGKTITLQGAACETLKDGRGHVLNAQVECSEVVLD